MKPVRSAKLEALSTGSTIHSIVLVESRFLECVIVGRARSLPIWFRLRDLEDWESVGSFYTELRHRVRQGPNGVHRLARLGQREAFFQRLLTPPGFGVALVGFLALVYGWVGSPSASAPSGEGVFFGAFIAALVASGEPYRVVTANFLHLNLQHLVYNASILILFAWKIEAAIGAKRTALLLLLSGVSGYGLMLLPWGLPEFTQLLECAGSSAAMWGLLGANVVLTTRRRRDFPVGFRTPWLLWTVVVLQLYLHQNIDVVPAAMHLGGGFSGLLAALWLTRGNRRLPLPETPGLERRVALAALIVLAAAAWAIRNDRLFGDAPYYAILDEHLTASDASNEDRNGYAWILAAIDHSPGASTQLALEVMEEVVARDPQSAYRDTLATLYYRLGDAQRSVAMMQTLWREKRDRWSASQLARFYHAALAATPAHERDGARAAAGLAEVRVTRLPDSHFEFATSLARAASGPATVHALVYETGELRGLLRVQIEAGSQEVKCRAQMKRYLGPEIGEMQVRSVWLGVAESGAVEPEARADAGACSLRFMDPAVGSLP